MGSVRLAASQKSSARHSLILGQELGEDGRDQEEDAVAEDGDGERDGTS